MAQKKTSSAVVEEPEVVFEYESDLIVSDSAEIMAELLEANPGGVNQSGIPVANFEGAILQSANGADMSARFVIVTRQKAVNRYGNLVQIQANESGGGLLLDSYQQNPVVLFNHGEGYSLPIGQSADKSGKLLVTLQKSKAFADVMFSQSNAFASDVFGLVQEGILKAASIGYMPLKAKRIKQNQQKLAEDVVDISPGGPNSWMGGMDFVESDLMEWSIVPIGADPGALRQCLSAGKIAGEKIASPFLKFWLQQRAEPKPAIGRGVDFSQGKLSSEDVDEVRQSHSGIQIHIDSNATEKDIPEIVEKMKQKMQQRAQSQGAPTKSETITATTQSGVVIHGTPEAVAAILQKVSPVVPVAPAIEQSAKPLDENRETAVNVPAVVQKVDPLVLAMQGLPGLIGKEIQKAFAPCQEQQSKLLETVRMLTGTVTP